MSEKSEIGVWMARIKAAQEKRDRIKKRIWDKCEDALEGTFKKDDSQIKIMMLLHTFLTMRATLFFQNPKYRVMSLSGNTTANSKYLEAALDYFVNDSNGLTTFKRQMKQIVSDAMAKIGIGREIYEQDLSVNPKAGQEVKVGEQPARDEQGNPVLEPQKIPVAEHFRTVRVSPDQHLVDVLAKQDLVEGTWVGEEWWRPLEDVKKDPRFSNTSKLKATAEAKDARDLSKIRSVQEQLHGGPVDERSRFVHGFYLEDIKDHKMLVIAEGHDKYLLEPTDVGRGIETTSYSFLQFIETNGDKFYGIPPIWPLIAPQLAYNEASEHLDRLRFYDIMKMLIEKNAFSASDKKKLASRTESQVIEPKTAGPLANKIHIPTPPQPRPLDTFSMDKAMSEISRLSGLTQEKLLGQSSAATLGQSQMIAQQSDIKEGERQDILVDFLNNVGIKKAQLIQSTFLLPLTIQSINEDGEITPLVILDRMQLAGSMNVRVEIGSTQRKNVVLERAQMNDAFTRFYPDPSPITQFFNPRVMAEKLQEVNTLPKELIVRDVTSGMAGGLPPPMPPVPANGNIQASPAAFPPRNVQDVMAGLLQRGRPEVPITETGV